MTKEEAVKEFVNRDLNAVPQEWVRIIEEHEGSYSSLPMWGTMWIVDNWLGERIMKNTRQLVPEKEDINLEEVEEKEGEERRKEVEKAIEEDDWLVLENYVDEEMGYANCVLDKDGDPTALYIYEVADEYVIGVNGAGWDFYDGVWDRLYDMLGLKWHKED